ncbi:hexosaminidase [Marchantia polymorpha subsp. ruderalis]|uniref:Beta-hexosaminidase n=1 Tax=Marchantia polymorpha TaxID=3197 RepID=A0A2R6W884_MARPO|nr:hypothetical protein MARPO_0130s0025 [Marchantia polymorpha]BBN00792.1 hypothetical protein Mp_2g02170 [Marchantia polymorpha subsp. ruderalis]|eukprot:PTQ30070.1 hypothetical protein MARPO_0130s0025 [Marchantia polymorpha]
MSSSSHRCNGKKYKSIEDEPVTSFPHLSINMLFRLYNEDSRVYGPVNPLLINKLRLQRAMAHQAVMCTSTSWSWTWRFIVFILILLQVAVADVFLWPEPQTVRWESGARIVLNPAFEISAPDHPELSSAVARYAALIRTERWYPVQVPRSVVITRKAGTDSEVVILNVFVVDLAADLQHGVDESYTIEISPTSSNASLSAGTVWGAMRGLETFSQLLRVAEPSANAPLYIERGVFISDKPNYPHRGILLDIARNFFPVEDIKRTIRALSHNKLNVLHLHITDAQSFPLEIKSEPDLAVKGSFGPQFIYYQEHVVDLVRYGRRHGVRVIPEIDAPGHTASWGGAHPDIVTCLDEFWLPNPADWSQRLASEPGSGQLNPLMDKTYEVVKNVIDEVAALFSDHFFHAGGDEVAPACWKRSDLVTDFLARPNDDARNNTLSDLLTTYIERTRAMIDVHNKTAVYWEDILLGAEVKVQRASVPAATTILQTWNNGPLNTKTLTAAGYRTIVSSNDFFYLDCGHGGFLGNDSQYDQNFNDDPTSTVNYGGRGGSWCAPFKTWARIYDYDITANLTEDEAKLVLGGEVALWSEQADETVLDAMLWPRSAALAESLWSGNRDPADATKKRSGDAIDRLNDWRFRLVHRGINAEPLQPLWCLKNPRMCNSVY